MSTILDAYNVLNFANEVEEQVVSGSTFRTPTAVHTWVIVGLAVLAGGGAGLLWQRSRARGATLLVVFLAAVAVASVEAYRTHQYLVNPLVPAFALVASGAWAAWSKARSG